MSADLSDFAAGFTSEATLSTQQTWVFRQGLSGRLWVPHMDPIRGSRALTDGALGYSYADTPGVWTVDQVLHPYAEHCMDVVETDEALFVCGASVHDDSTVWLTIYKSTDRGTTWTEDLTVANTNGGPNRFYCFFDWGDGSLSCCYAGNLPAPEFLAYHRPVGGSWTSYDDPVLDPPIDFDQNVSDAVLFTYNGTPFQIVQSNGKQDAQVDVVHQTLTAHVQPGDEALRDTIQATLPLGTDVWVSGDGQRAYVVQNLSGAGAVLLGDTTGAWTSILTFDGTTTPGYGIAVDETNGWIYLSGVAEVSRFALPA